MGMVLELLTEIGEGEEFEAWVGEGKAVLSEGDFLGEVFHDVNAGDEEERQDVKAIGALGATLLGNVQDLLMKGLVCAFELGVEKLGVG
jgi:hypothetical protein